MAEWINSLAITEDSNGDLNISFDLDVTSSTATITVTHDETTYDAIDVGEAALGLKIVGTTLFRETAQSEISTTMKTVAKAITGVDLVFSKDDLTSSSNNYFLVLGEEDLRNGRALCLHAPEKGQVDIEYDNGELIFYAHAPTT